MLNTIERPETVTETVTPALTDEQITALAEQLKEARATRKQKQEAEKEAETERIETILAKIRPMAESIGHKVVKGRKSRT